MSAADERDVKETVELLARMAVNRVLAMGGTHELIEAEADRAQQALDRGEQPEGGWMTADMITAVRAELAKRAAA